jgi:ribosomal-protein-alanine N-acetyltransferase
LSSSPRAAVELVVPGPECEAEFLTLVAKSADLHMGWVQPPSDPDAYARYLRRITLPNHKGFIAREIATGSVVGVVNLNDIVLGALRSASLGYYGFESSTGQGRMTEAVRLSIDHGFGELGLHRLEANIQPGNGPSRALVQRLGFRLEGFSPRYLYVAGAWRDHERWAVLSEDWRSSGSQRTA